MWSIFITGINKMTEKYHYYCITILAKGQLSTIFFKTNKKKTPLWLIKDTAKEYGIDFDEDSFVIINISYLGKMSDIFFNGSVNEDQIELQIPAGYVKRQPMEDIWLYPDIAGYMLTAGTKYRIKLRSQKELTISIQMPMNDIKDSKELHEFLFENSCNLKQLDLPDKVECYKVIEYLDFDENY